MILFLLLLLLIGGLVYYWQKDPIIVEKFVSSTPGDFLSYLIDSTDMYGNTITGTVYMYYVLTTNYLYGTNTSGPDGIPANGGDPRFNMLTNINLRLASEEEKAYFLRNGGINRETSDSYLLPTGIVMYNQARLVVSTKKPDIRWDVTNSPYVFFMPPSSTQTIAYERVMQEKWIRDVVRYPFDNTPNTFKVFTISKANYIQSVSDCIFVGKAAAQALSPLGISQITLGHTAPSFDKIATNEYIAYADIDINNTSSSRSPGSSSSSSRSPGSSSSFRSTSGFTSGPSSSQEITYYNGENRGDTPDKVKTKLAAINQILDKPDGTNFTDASGVKISLRKAIQQKCGATIFNKLLLFDAIANAPACGKAMNALINYKIAFSDYKYLLDCTMCYEDNSGCRPGTLPIPSTTSFAKLSQPIDLLENESTVTSTESGITLTMGNISRDTIKLGNGFTYELQLVDVSDGADKYIFNPVRFVAGRRDNTNADIDKLEIIINEFTNTIEVNSIATNQRVSLGTTSTPTNFKLYSTIKLEAVIYTYANRSILENIEKYSVLYTDQVISNETRYGLYKSIVYNRAASTPKIEFEYNNANSIKATFTNNNMSRIIPVGNYTLNFSNSQLGSFLDTSGAKIGESVGQFTYILLDVLTGKLSFMNNSSEIYSIQTKLKETAGDIEFTIALKDPANRQTYYSGDYTVLGNRYDGTVQVTSSDLLLSSSSPSILSTPSSSSSSTAAAATTATTAAATVRKKGDDEAEVVYIESPINGGIDATTAVQLARNLRGELATIDQVVNAMLAGANWCSPGWCIFTDKNNKPVIRAAYPITSQILDSKCIPQDDSISLYNNGVVVVSTPTSLKAHLMVYRKKEPIPSNITQNSLVYKQSYFNAMMGLWKENSTDISGSEIFAITKKTGTIDNKVIADIADKLNCTILTLQQIEKQFEYIKGKGIPLPNITVSGWALNNSNFPIKIKLDGKLTTLGNNEVINSLYCYGNKDKATEILATDKFGTPPIYDMQPYNAQINMANQDDNAPYKPLNLTTQTLINKAGKYNVKAALIVKEARETNGGIIKRFEANVPINASSSFTEPFTVINNGKYVGCDINSYACLLDGSGEKQFVPLISKTNKFKIMPMESSNGSFDKPDTMEQAIQNVLACQAAGGDIAITDDTYPGCPAGNCCEPTEPADNTELNTSMFPETCDDSNSASAIEQCDETEEVLSSNQQSFDPYKLTRVQRTKTPTTAKCSKPKLSKTLKSIITEKFKNTSEYARDVYEITKNERAFSLRML